LSGYICEICGAPGEIVRSGWRCCRCPAHVNPIDTDTDEPAPPRPHAKPKPPAKAGVNGLGDGWAALVTRLAATLDADRQLNGMPPVKLAIKTTQGRLAVGLTGGNDTARGMVALVNDYSTRVDARSGRLCQPIQEESNDY
jgi:hypothetical protein